MASKIQVYNLALSSIGNDSTVAAADEKSKPARVCTLWWETCLKAVLQDFPWNFATKFVALAASTESIPGYANAYLYPADAVKAITITDAGGARIGGGGYYHSGTFGYGWALSQINHVPFKLFAGAQQSLIATDLQQAYLMYTTYVDNPERWPSQFVEVMALRLASAIAMPMSASAEVLARISQAYQQRLADAHASSMNEERDDPDPVTPALGARW